MPPLPGETLLLTLFADVHYYFNPPESRPVHDRFDKASYVYLYHNSTQRKARLEVANAPGTSNQDAFNGYLDAVLVKNKHQHPTLLSVTVDGVPDPSPFRQTDQSQWRLPAYDLKNDQKYLYKLHSIDVYFWTANDASRFLDILKRLLPQHQLDVLQSPSAIEHRDSMSPVVEKLEHAAIHSPPHLRTPSAVSSYHRATTSSPNNPLQPVAPASTSNTPVAQPAFAPYNPAAPAAPEPIAHREKTPPPIDAETGTGLAAAAMHDQGAQFANPPPLAHHLSYQQAPYQQAFPGPPQRSTSIQSLPPPPPLNMSSVSPKPALPLSPPPNQLSFQTQTHQPQTQFATYPSGYPQSIAHPLQSPGLPGTPGAPPPYGNLAPLQSPGLPQHTPLQANRPPPPSGPPAGGYANYNYAQQSQQPQAHGEAYQVHGQVYRPTESEAAHGRAKSAQPAKPGAFEDRMGKLEKGVGRFLRKLDNKI